MNAWFRRQKQSNDNQESETGLEVSSSVFRSLALNNLFHQFRSDRKYQILDLGSAVPENIEFFSQFSCRLYVEDLYETLNSFDYLSPEDGFSFEAVYSYLLPYKTRVNFDAILAWDLLNYLERDEFRHLILHLTKHCFSGTLFFALISSHKNIPESPHRFHIIDEEKLRYESKSKVFRKSPRYEKTDLDHLMPGFRVCNSFLLRNGYREYLFVYE